MHTFLEGGESDRKISLREPRIRWEENVEAGVKKMGGCRLDARTCQWCVIGILSVML